MKTTLLILIYIAGMFLTNSYAVAYRWDDWAEQMSDHRSPDIDTLFATVFWPVYWMSRGTTYLVTLPLDFKLVPLEETQCDRS